MIGQTARWLLPVAVFAALLGFWEWAVAFYAIKSFVLPAPSAVGATLISELPSLLAATWVTLRLTLISFALALVIGVAVAMAFASSTLVERALYPYAVILQVTPIVSIAPLIIIWVGIDNVQTAILILATIVAVFPILSAVTQGLKSADRNLKELFRIYGANGLQRLTLLQAPTALPYLAAGAKIAGGLALVGTVVAEFVAGTGSSAGLAWRIVEAGNRLQIAKMFAALTLLALLGVLIFAALSFASWYALRNWHESEAGDPE